MALTHLVVQLPGNISPQALHEILEAHEIVVYVCEAHGLEEETPALTRAELAVLCAFTHCDCDHDIAGLLGVSMSTVRTHVKHVLQKLGASSRGVAIGNALRLGLLSSDDIASSSTPPVSPPVFCPRPACPPNPPSLGGEE